MASTTKIDLSKARKVTDPEGLALMERMNKLAEVRAKSWEMLRKLRRQFPDDPVLKQKTQGDERGEKWPEQIIREHFEETRNLGRAAE